MGKFNAASQLPPVIKRLILRTFPLLSAAAIIVASLSPMQVSAQQSNPLSDLLGTIKKIAAGPNGTQKEAAQAAPAGQEVGAGDASTDDIMRSIASDFTYKANASFCEFYPKQDDQILLAQKTGKYNDAGIKAKLQASYEAACALGNHGSTLAQAKGDVGTLLAISALNFHRGGMVTDDTVLDAKYAKALLKLNEGTNRQLIAQLDETFWPKGPTADARAFATMSGLEAATKYQQNTFSFERTYAGKTLQIKGRVQNITGSDSRAAMTIEGIKRGVDQQGWQDIVRCEIKDKAAVDDAAQISKGDAVSVQGVFKKGPLPGVSLEDCRLVR